MARIQSGEVVVTGQGSEFKGAFASAIEQSGICHHVTDAEAPWENGTTEQYGQTLEEGYLIACADFEPLNEEK